MQLGLSTYTYGWAVDNQGVVSPKFTEKDLLEKTHKYGLHLVQIGDNLPLHEMSEHRIDLLLNDARDLNISIEIGARNLTAEHLSRYIEISKKLKANLLRFVIDGRGYEPDIKTVVDILKDFVPALEQKKIKLGLENHDRFKAREFAEIIEKVGSRYVGICLDSVNSIGAGEGLEQIIDVLAPYTLNLHIKDFGIKRLPHLMGFQIDGRPAGKGMLNIPWLLEKIKKYSQCQTAILEQWVVPEKDLKVTIDKENTWAEESLNYLKPYFN